MRRRVLIVDDEPAVGRTMKRLLGEAHDVIVLSSGHDAIGLFENGEDFDIIFCDLAMPELSGMDLYAKVVARRADLAGRFVFMSGGVHSSRAAEFLEQLPNRRLDKPFDLETVRRMVRTPP